MTRGARQVLFWALLATLALPAVVQAQDFAYTDNGDGTCTITGYTGSVAEVTIPGTIGGLTVTSITCANWPNTFAGCTSVTLPDGLTSIGESAFASCHNLTSVTIPNSVTNVGSDVFRDCGSLTNVVIGSRGGSIGKSMFFGCSALTSVTILTGVTNIGYAAFDGCSSLTSITIPNSVTNIGSSAFAGCSNLTSVLFQGDAPFGPFYYCFNGDPATVYYLPGSKGWGPTYDGCPTALWPGSANVTVTGNPPQGGIVLRSGTYAVGTTVNLAAVASDGWLFTAWNDGSTNNPYSIMMPTTDVTFAASFKAQFNYRTNADNTLTITSYLGAGGVVNIHGMIGGLSVTSIGEAAFLACSNLTEVVIPGSVTSIGSGAFGACANLANVIIPDCVTNIGEAAFAECYGLTSVTIPGSVVNIGCWAFNMCGLTNVVIPVSVTSIGEGVFSTCQQLTSVMIPDTVTNIGDQAFYSCPSLTSMAIPDSVTSIGNQAFCFCGGLITLTVGNGVTDIGDQAFAWCSGLSDIHFEGNAPSRIGSDCFIGNPATVYYLPGTTGWGSFLGGVPTVPPGYDWSDNGDGTCTVTGYTGPGGEVTIPGTIDGLTVTGIVGLERQQSTFARCTNVTLPDGLTSIENSAFSGCGNLSGVTLNSGLTSIGDYAFLFCPRLTDIVIPNSVTNIGNAAFALCYGLAAVTISDKVASIGENAFLFCGALTNVVIGSGVTSIGAYAFSGCMLLTSMTIPDRVTSIGEYAFRDCSGLTNLVIADGVTRIGSGAFAACFGLANIAVTASNAVYSSANGVLFDKAQTTLVEYPGGRNGTCTIPDGVTSIGDSAFEGCANLTSVTIPGSVASIGGGAFCGCASLTAAYFRGNAPADDGAEFSGDGAIVYFLPGTTNWSSSFGGLDTALWNPQVQPDATFGVTANCFGFTLTNAGTPAVVVEACTNLASPVWLPVTTNTLTVGSSCFIDPDWTNHPARFYRFRMP